MKVEQKIILHLPDGNKLEISRKDAESLRDSLVDLLGNKTPITLTRDNFPDLFPRIKKTMPYNPPEIWCKSDLE